MLMVVSNVEPPFDTLMVVSSVEPPFDTLMVVSNVEPLPLIIISPEQ